MKRVLSILAGSCTVVAILVAAAGGWFYWRYLTASRDSLVETPVVLSAEATYHLALRPPRRLKRAKVLVEFALPQACSSVNLSDRNSNKIDYPDGRSVYLEALCVDSDGVKHPMYVEGYAPKRLFWVFAEALSRKMSFRSLEITASDEQTLSDIVWIDCQPM